MIKARDLTVSKREVIEGLRILINTLEVVEDERNIDHASIRIDSIPARRTGDILSDLQYETIGFDATIEMRVFHSVLETEEPVKQKTINSWQKAVHKCAISKGWWDWERGVPELLCLIHSEVSEALEAYRNNLEAEKFAEELADVAIRLLDSCEHWGIDLEAAIQKKHKYNLSRKYRHGGKKC